MKTCAVPVEPTAEMIVAGNLAMQSPYANQHTVSGVYKAMLAAAPPQSEPADHLAAPDSRERARNALRAIINAGSIGQARRIAMQALVGDTNAAPEQSERESITSPSQEGCAAGPAPAAAPERRIAQRRIGKPWSGIVHARLGYDRRYNAAVESPVPAAPFEREWRYIVLKRKDVAEYLTEKEQDILRTLVKCVDAGRSQAGKRTMNCVVVEDDWPEYEPVWKMIEARMNNTAGQEPMPDTERGIAADRGNPFACKPDNAGNERPSGGLSTNSPVSAAPASTLPLSAELRNARKVLDQYTATLRDGEPSLYLEAADRIDALESDLRGVIENAITYRRKIRELEQPLAGLKSEWFHKGQESVRRKNESGCCCKIDDDDKILSACNAHAEWATQQLTEKDREIASLKSDARFQLTEKMLEAAARKQRELEAELAELRRAR